MQRLEEREVPTETTATAAEIASRLARLARSTARLCGRTDLIGRIERIGVGIGDPNTRILVAGEFKTGKSSLVNAVVGHDVCPTDTDAATAVATVVRAEPAPCASILVRRGGGDLEMVDVDPADLGDWVTEDGPARHGVLAHGDELVVAAVGVPTDWLAPGLLMIDLPGVGGLGSLAGAATLSAAAHAHGVVFVTDGGRPLAADEQAFLAELVRRCHHVVLVESRIDLHPAWREVLGSDREVVKTDTDGCMAVSSELLNLVGVDREEGIAALRGWLADVSKDAGRSAGLRLAVFAEQAGRAMRAPLEAELAALGEDDAPGVLDVCRAEQQRLRSAGARWSQLLSDGFADLAADSDYRMRERLREVVRDGEAQLADVDPARGWGGLASGWRRALGDVVDAHFVLVDRRVEEIARTLARLVAPDEESAAALGDELMAVALGADVGQDVAERDLALGELPRSGLGTKSLVLLRSSYSSALMIGFLGSVIGLSLAAPAVLAVGAVLGTRGLMQENTRQIDHRRQLAATALRRHTEELATALGKESRDRIRRGQRVLRDAISAELESRLRTAGDALARAERVAAASAAERASRRSAIAVELRRVDTLLAASRNVQTILAEPAR